MPNIINIKSKKNKFLSSHKQSRRRVIYVVLAGIVTLGIVACIVFYVQNSSKKNTTSTDRVVRLQAYVTQKEDLAKDNPDDITARDDYYEAKSRLYNEYLDSGEYDKASELFADSSKIIKLQVAATIAEKKGDYAAAIAACNKQIAYYQDGSNEAANSRYRISLVRLTINRLERLQASDKNN